MNKHSPSVISPGPFASACEEKQVKSFNTARVVKQMSTLMLKYAIYAFSVEKQLTSVLNI